MIDLSNYIYHNEPFEHCESTISFSNDIYETLNKNFPTLEDINKQLNSLIDQNFDIFKFNNDCRKNSLFTCMFYFYKKLDIEKYHIKENIFLNLIYNIQKK